MAVELTLYLRQGDPNRFLIPDLRRQQHIGDQEPATGDLREVYRIWDGGGRPT